MFQFIRTIVGIFFNKRAGSFSAYVLPSFEQLHV